LFFASCTVGVGHDEEPVSEVRRADGDSRYIKRPRGVAQRFKIIEDVVKDCCAYSRNILSKHPSGPEFSNDSEVFRPEVAVVVFALSFPGKTVWLAGESPANKGNWLKIMGADFAHVSVSLDVGPVLCKDSAAVVIDFNLPPNFHSGTFKAKIKPADAAE